jgi:hypothetical protein
MQQKNSLVSRNDHVAASANDEETGSGDGFETAKPNLRLNLDFLKDNKEEKNAKCGDDKDASDDSGTDYENDDSPFATNRNIQTVKVNEPRKPLATTSKVAKELTENSK